MDPLTVKARQRLERLTVVTPLGIRFWDPVRDRPIRDGLNVTARPAAAPGSVTSTHACRTRSGIYAFQELPGLRDIEYPIGDPLLETSPPSSRRFVIEVEDHRRRFLPTVFDVAVPFEGIFPVDASASPPENGPPGFYLFSAPTRPTLPGLVALRGQLVEANTEPERPAAHAVLEVRVDGKTWYGVADKRGCVVVLFPYPPFITLLTTSPPVGTSPLQRPWDLTVRVRYGPAALTYPPGARTPDVRSVFGQSPGWIWPTQAGPAVREWSVELFFGRELVMRTDDLSTLWASSGASPP